MRERSAATLDLDRNDHPARPEDEIHLQISLAPIEQLADAGRGGVGEVGPHR